MTRSFKRVLVKLSGEALTAPDGYWLDPQTLSALAQDLADATSAGFEIALVIGGGNIIRGARMSAAGWIDRPTADSMGMLGTVMNSLALETALNAAGVPARTMSAVSMPTICETYARQPALHHLETRARSSCSPAAPATRSSPPTPRPFCGRRSCAATRCSRQPRWTASIPPTPKKDPGAIRYDRLTHDEAIARDLKVMDTAAFALARESRLPIIVGSAPCSEFRRQRSWTAARPRPSWPLEAGASEA